MLARETWPNISSMTVLRAEADGLSLLIARPTARWRVRSHPGIQTGDFRPSQLQRETKNIRMSASASLTERISCWAARAWLGFVRGKDVMRAILRVSISTYLYLTVSMCSASVRVTASSTATCRLRERVDDNGCALSAEIVIFANLSVEEATSTRDGTCLLSGCTTFDVRGR